MNPILFLDIDGVLNPMVRKGRAMIDPDCVEHLNNVITSTGCDIVISSAWRYLVLQGSMTVGGFGYLLQTHGVINRVIGTTELDIDFDARRCDQILKYMAGETCPYAVVDDSDFGFTANKMPFVKTDPRLGLTGEDAIKLIDLL